MEGNPRLWLHGGHPPGPVRMRPAKAGSESDVATRDTLGGSWCTSVQLAAAGRPGPSPGRRGDGWSTATCLMLWQVGFASVRLAGVCELRCAFFAQNGLFYTARCTYGSCTVIPRAVGWSMGWHGAVGGTCFGGAGVLVMTVSDPIRMVRPVCRSPCTVFTRPVALPSK